ncbi:MAG: hypothetical protein QGH15_01060 [Kiritimatiellia bacterium]|nr:hypothetical protein [Kiritimatiellia bacterium]
MVRSRLGRWTLGVGRWTLITLFLCLAFAVQVVQGQDAPAEETEPEIQPVVIDFFFEPGCDQCARVRDEVLPQLEAAYAGLYDLNEWDVSVEENHRRLIRLIHDRDIADNARVFMFLDRSVALSGLEAILADLFPALDRLVAEHLNADVSESGPVEELAPADDTMMEELAGQFTLAAVVLGGLADGINPCAIATLVFLISVLSMSHVRGKDLLLVGGAFCLASFLTYMAIGFGLLQVLRSLSAFHQIQKIIDIVLVAILCALAGYSFLDAFRFGRSHKASDVTIQLPKKVKDRIHRLLRVGLGRHASVLPAFIIGVAVTGLESICTGQVLLPTLAFVARSGISVVKGTAYLALYNLMFIVPLVVVLLLTWQGLKLPRLMAWSVKEVFVAKLLLGVFFLLLAVAIFVLG